MNFEFELFFVAEILKFTTATFEKDRAGRVDPVFRELRPFEYVYYAEARCDFNHLSPDAVAGKATGGKQGITFMAAEPIAAGAASVPVPEPNHSKGTAEWTPMARVYRPPHVAGSRGPIET